MPYSHNPRALILGLLSCCPFKECDRDCPLSDVRKSHVSEKKTLAFSQFTDTQVARLVSYHKYCSIQRDNPLADRCKVEVPRPDISFSDR